MPIGFSRGTLLVGEAFPVTDGLVMWVSTKEPASNPGDGNLYDLSSTGLTFTGSSSKITSTGLRGGGTAYSSQTTSILNDDTHTIFYYFRQTGFTSGWQKIFEYAPSGTDRSPGVWRYSNRRSWHWRYDPGNTDAGMGYTGTDSGGAQFSDNTDYFIGVTKNGSTSRAWVNRLMVAQRGVSNPKRAGNAPIRLMQTGATNIYCDSWFIWNRVLSDDEIYKVHDFVKGKYYPNLESRS